MALEEHRASTQDALKFVRVACKAAVDDGEVGDRLVDNVSTVLMGPSGGLGAFQIVLSNGQTFMVWTSEVR